MSELKPCPFCGAEAIAFPYAGMFYVKCVPCQVEILRNTRDEAVRDWNHRAQPSNEPLTLDELREMDEEPVYCVYPECSTGGEWFLVNSQGAYKNGGFLSFRYYGEWLAYRRKPEPKGKIEK